MALGVEQILWFMVLLVASVGGILLLLVRGEILRMRSETGSGSILVHLRGRTR
jgi:hypothetical protein